MHWDHMGSHGRISDSCTPSFSSDMVLKETPLSQLVVMHEEIYTLSSHKGNLWYIHEHMYSTLACTGRLIERVEMNPTQGPRQTTESKTSVHVHVTDLLYSSSLDVQANLSMQPVVGRRVPPGLRSGLQKF